MDGERREEMTQVSVVAIIIIIIAIIVILVIAIKPNITIIFDQVWLEWFSIL